MLSFGIPKPVRLSKCKNVLSFCTREIEKDDYLDSLFYISMHTTHPPTLTHLALLMQTTGALPSPSSAPTQHLPYPTCCTELESLSEMAEYTVIAMSY